MAHPPGADGTRGAAGLPAPRRRLTFWDWLQQERVFRWLPLIPVQFLMLTLLAVPFLLTIYISLLRWRLSGGFWTDARFLCVEKNVGGTRGWRLPSVVELMSLIDPSLINTSSGIPPIVPGVFTGVQSATYWSATANADLPGSTSRLLLNFNDGTVSPLGKGNAANCWCVRGPMSESAY